MLGELRTEVRTGSLPLAADATGPVVLAGSDVGALHALSLSTRGAFAGVVLAGVPWSTVRAGAVTLAWDAELEARSACPTHQARLTGDSGFQRGALAESVPAGLQASIAPTAIGVPVLILEVDAERRRLSLSLKRVDADRRAESEGPIEGTPHLDLSEDVFSDSASAPLAPELGEDRLSTARTLAVTSRAEKGLTM